MMKPVSFGFVLVFRFGFGFPLIWIWIWIGFGITFGFGFVSVSVSLRFVQFSVVLYSEISFGCVIESLAHSAGDPSDLGVDGEE
jgi:hypothetical protein